MLLRNNGALDYTKIHKYPYKRGDLMDITVTGVRSKKTKRIIAKAAEFYGSLLLSKRMANTICLDIKLMKKLDDPDTEGYCQFIERDVGYRLFEIELLKDVPLEEILRNLAHEMVHLKQFATGELDYNVKPAHISKWHGLSVNEKTVNYWDLPWEIEAFGREKGLFYRFCDKHNIYK